MKKALTYLAIILLLSSLIITLVPNIVFSKTQDIKVVSYSYTIDNGGVLDIFGEIQNTGADTIQKVNLEGTVSSADGTEIGVSTCTAWVGYMAPGQKAPFMIEFIKAPTGYSDWFTADISKIAISVTEAPAANSHYYPDLTISVSSAGVSTTGDDKGTYWVSGTVKNIGTQTVSKIVVAATFYNSSGQVISTGLTDYLTPESLSPSGTVSFKVGAYYTDQSAEPESRKITSYTLNVQATSPVLDGPATSVPGTSPQQSTSTQQNDPAASNQNLIYILIIAGVVIAVVAALLVSRGGKRSEPEAEVEVKKKPVKKR
jgi:hypothetical protein